MNDLDDTRWMIHHFEKDAIELDSVRFTVELFKTIVVVAFGLLVIYTVV